MTSTIWQHNLDESARLAWINQQRQAALRRAGEHEQAAARADSEGRSGTAAIERLRAAALRREAEGLK